MEEIGEDCHFFKDDNVCSSENDEDLQMTEINKSFLVKSSATNSKRGVCYLSRIQRHMDHVKLRHILSRYGDIERIYLVPENPAAQMSRKRSGGYRGTEFSEGWVEFSKKSTAKRVANMLNGEQMGGKKRSPFYYDLWNIKYLRKFKWDDLTEETAQKCAVREQKLNLEISAAKRERDFYLKKVDQSRGLTSMQERVNKKQKTEDTESKGGTSKENKMKRKIIRHFPQNKLIGENNVLKKKHGLSKDFLSEVFGVSTTTHD
ncbi:hypothetical protein ZOSMA_226G00260 [Zostera marina]|uniref:RRM domain-containing protein n=1 Tax=Zostera marina TaxID=29655 RepID=A0A0K9PIX7_ZOSMR|nr:hypothetical protein ZOSMA_226G00260 [Zostera marina]